MMQKQLNISKNILPKIPQFWETPSAAFAELVQNAFRADATEIHIQVDGEAGKLSVRDNGQGIQSLEDFLTIGDSAWNEEIPDPSDKKIGTVGDDIIEPADMGFYAHFRYSQATNVLSRGKCYPFTPDCLQGAPVEIQSFDDADTVPNTWEEICREWTLRAGAAGALPYLPDEVGSAWTAEAQVDVVGINAMEKTLILGECKWTRTPNNRKALVQLVEEKAGKIIPRQGNWNVFLVGFSRAGWTSGALAYQEQINQQPPAGKNWKVSGMRLVELEQLDQDLQKWTN